MSIKIPVSAQFDAADVKKQIQIINDQIRNLSNMVAMANKQKFEPITLKSKDDLQAFTAQVQKLLKIQTELGQKLGQSGQGGKNPFVADWSKMYADKAQRMEKMRNALQFMGVEFDDLPTPKVKPPAPVPPAPPGRPPVPALGGGGGPNWNSGWGRQGLNVLNSGLNAAGPVGGVFSSALSSGMSAGAGAGLMGLVGGLAALGVGKIIGAIADKIGKAQDAAIGMDKIYRQIGGIASYSAIKNTAYGVGSTLGMDVSESIGLASAYSRAANLRRGDNLGTGMLISGGLARTYGMDPNSVAGIMGGFRGSNIAKNDQDSKKIGLVIGEAIAKSGAFAKADEVMQAVSQYAIAQARQSLNAPSIGAYGGAMSSLMGMNLPGMDVAGSSALLSRVNAAMMQGGAHGEASQYLTARVGNAMGLNPFQLKMMRENGMFATKDSTFGVDSIYGKTLGAGPGGDQSYFSATRDQLRRNYGGNTPDYYMAMANHMGISVAQAMALDKMDTSTVNGAGTRMGRLGLDMAKVNATSLGTLGQIESGKGLGELANQYLTMGGENALNDKERKKLTAAYSGSDPEALKDALMEVAAKHGAVETEGSQIRDGIAKLDSTMTRLAENAIPALNVMRMALVKMSGGSESDLRASYIKSEKESRAREINAKYAGKEKALRDKDNALYSQNGAFGAGEAKAASTKAMQDLNRQKMAEIDAAYAEVDKNFAAKASSGEGAGMTSNLGPSPAAAAAESGSSAPASGGGGGGGGGGSAGSRNVNGGNVGNLRNRDGTWQRHTSTREGMAAMATQLLRYQSGRFNKYSRKKTLRQIISTYAPSNENNTDEYVAQVSKWTGLSPDSEIDLRDMSTMKKVMQAMIRKENGQNGLGAAEGHYNEAIGDAMRNSGRWQNDGYMPQEINLNMKLDAPQGTYSAQHTLKPSFKQQKSFEGRFQ